MITLKFFLESIVIAAIACLFMIAMIKASDREFRLKLEHECSSGDLYSCSELNKIPE